MTVPTNLESQRPPRPHPVSSRTTLPPLRFEAYLRPMVWGGRRLAERLGKPLPSADAFGESWEVSDHDSHHSLLAAGPHAGRTLRHLMTHDRAALLGSAAGRHATFPWLVKFLDASDWLSVQVHPDEEAVTRLWPGEGSKTEAWFILDVAPGGRVYAGLKPGVGEAHLRAALAAGAVADCLHSFTPRPGDCVFLPAGTVHAVGGGVLIAEVQQTSDATFRLFDWNRVDRHGKSRQLHVEESMASIHWHRGPVNPIPVTEFGRAVHGVRRTELVRCGYFHLDYYSASAAFTLGGEGRLQTLLVLEGGGRLAAAHGHERLAVGQTWVLPASLPAVTVQPEGRLGLLVSTLPA